MRFLVLQAYLKLISFDFHLSRGDFNALHGKVRNYPLRKQAYSPDDHAQENPSEDTPTILAISERICGAVDIACIWYWKQALCLQRSAATACLLKKYGVPAQLVIGAQQMPFKAHAWVEVDGRVVNDKPYMPEMYAVLDRC